VKRSRTSEKKNVREIIKSCGAVNPRLKLTGNYKVGDKSCCEMISRLKNRKEFYLKVAHDGRASETKNIRRNNSLLRQ